MNYDIPPSTGSAAEPAPAGPGLPERALYEQVAEALRARILSHRLAPGSWIDEKALAAEFGISRTPLREALKVLAAEGLVTMKLRRGAYVTEMSAQDVSQVYHLLGVLESDAAAAEGPRERTGLTLPVLHRRGHVNPRTGESSVRRGRCAGVRP